VKLTIPGVRGVSYGTGFFIAPGLILTCAHVVEDLGNKSIQVRWQNQENWAEAVVEKSLPDPDDLALLRVILPTDVDPPCVYLGEEVQSRDKLYLFGYPDEGDPQGEPRTFNCDGKTGSEIPWILFNLGQVCRGMSGSPLLNQQTRKVCGIVKFTRDRKIDMGGGAVTSTVILDRFPELLELQRSFHQKDLRWNNLMGELFNNSAQAQQTVKKILLLSANPENTTTSRKRTGIKEIRDALKRANHGKLLDIQERLEISAVDISQSLSELEPYIVNISGCEDGIEGLILDEIHNDNVLFDKKETLIADLFQSHSNNIECIILNSCYSEKQAKEIIKHIEFVIGIGQNLEDKVVVNFLTEFYYQIGSQRTISHSYYQSRNLLERTGTNPDWLPILLNKQEEIRRDDLEKKLMSCNLAIKNNINDAKLWAEKANLLTRLDRPDEVDKAYEKAVELEKEDYRIWWKKGQALVGIKKYFEAEQSYDRTVALKPPAPDSYMIFREYGFILKELGQHQRSIIKYKKSLCIEPRNRVSSYEKRQVYKKMYFGAD